MELKPRRNRIQLMALLLPGVLVFAMFTIYPILKLLYMSFLEWNRDNMFEHGFAGLANYAAVLGDATFRTAFANTLITRKRGMEFINTAASRPSTICPGTVTRV